MAQLVAVLFALGLLASTAMAQQFPTSGNIFFGYALTNGQLGPGNSGTLNGWEGSIEGRVFPGIGVVADVGQQYGNLFLPALGANASTQNTSALIGPRLSIRFGKFRPFVQALLGAAHLHEDALGVFRSETAFSDALGGGVDYRLRPHMSVRFQVDNLQMNYGDIRRNDLRFATGVVFHF